MSYCPQHHAHYKERCPACQIELSSESEKQNAAGQSAPRSSQSSGWGHMAGGSAPSAPSEKLQPTPRTDAFELERAQAVHESWKGAVKQFCDAVDFARQLERELAEAEAELERRQAKIMAAQSATVDTFDGPEPAILVGASWVKRMAERVQPNKDWACAECAPHSDILVQGFRCYYHKALAAIASTAKGEGEDG